MQSWSLAGCLELYNNFIYYKLGNFTVFFCFFLGNNNNCSFISLAAES